MTLLSIYNTMYREHNELILHQIDDMAIQTNDDNIAKEIFETIELGLQLGNIDVSYFAYLGYSIEINGVDIEQNKFYNMFCYGDFIDQIF